MGIDRSQSYYRGVLIPDTRLQTVWAAQSSYTEAGPRAGDPIPGQGTALDLRGSGDQSTEVLVATQQAGLPGRGWDAGSLRWRKTSAESWRGWDVPVSSMGWEAVVNTRGVAAGYTSLYHPHAVTLQDGTVLCVAEGLYVVGGVTHYRVATWARHPSTHAWGSSVTVETTTSAPSQDYHPCLLVLPSGRVLCLYWVVDETAEEGQLRVQFSDDQGTTWTTYRDHILESPVDLAGTPGFGSNGYDLGRLRATYLDGSVVIVAGLLGHSTAATRGIFRQYVSSDLCNSASLLSHWGLSTATGSGGYHDLAVVDGHILMAYITVDDSYPYCRRISNASELFSAAIDLDMGSGTWAYPWGVLDAGSNYVEDGDLSLVVDDDGVAYAYGRYAFGTQMGVVSRSVDAGATWGGMGGGDPSYSKWCGTTDTHTYPRGIAGTSQRGRTVLLHGFEADPGTGDNSLCASYLGGYTNVTMPGVVSMPTDLTRAWFEVSWLPYDLPGDVTGWTAAGTGTDALGAGYLTVTTAGDTRTYEYTSGSHVDTGYICRFVFQAVSGGDLAAGNVGFLLCQTSAAHDYRVQINVDEAGMRLIDATSGGTIGSDMVVDCTAGVEVLIVFCGASVRVWYRLRDTSEDHTWTDGPASDAVSDGGATGTVFGFVRWGNLTAANAVSRWFEVHLSDEGYVGEIQDLLDFSNPTSLVGRAISTEPVYISSGLYLSATAGPTVPGDTWTVTPSYDYGITKALPTVQPSPRRGWRNLQHSTVQTIAFALDPTLLATAESMLDSDILGVGLFNCNLDNFKIQGYDTDTSAWVDLLTVYSTAGMSGLTWRRRGNTVIPGNNPGTFNPYLFRGEYDGSTFSLDGTLRLIDRHSEGRMGPGTSRALTAVLDGITGAEGASGTAGTIRAKDVVGIVKLAGARYAGYRIYIPSQTTVEGYYRIGTLIIGSVAVFGTDPAWGRSVEQTTGIELTERRDGTYGIYESRPARRVVEVSWSDGVDTSNAFTANGDPDYINDMSGGLAVATPADLPFLLEGVARQSPTLPMVYLPRIPYSGATTTLNRREQLLLGQMVGSVRRESVQGEEGATELVRVETITLREVI